MECSRYMIADSQWLSQPCHGQRVYGREAGRADAADRLAIAGVGEVNLGCLVRRDNFYCERCQFNSPKYQIAGYK